MPRFENPEPATVESNRPSGLSFRRWIAAIPPGAIIRAGNLLGALAFFSDIPHRRIARRNLKFAFPDWSERRVIHTARKSFQNVATTTLEIFQMMFFRKGDFYKKVVFKGRKHIEQGLEKGNGVILISAHMGNWEMIPASLPLFFTHPLVFVARKLRYHPVAKRISRLRTRFGSTEVDMKGAMSDLMKALRRNCILGLVIDQDIRSSIGVKTRFFNRDVISTHGAAVLALRCKSSVVPIFCHRENDGVLVVTAKPPINIVKTKDLRADIQANTQKMTDAIETAVREHSEQWLWLHKRWKKFYPQLYPESMKRRRQRRARKNKKFERHI